MSIVKARMACGTFQVDLQTGKAVDTAGWEGTGHGSMRLTAGNHPNNHNTNYVNSITPAAPFYINVLSGFSSGTF